MAKMSRYQSEPNWIHHVAWGRAQPHLTPLELFRIGAWKSAKGLASMSLNEPGAIEACTARTMERIATVSKNGHNWRATDIRGRSASQYPGLWEDWLDLSWDVVGSLRPPNGLLSLDGVGYPMATAILCILLPSVFPVVDRWAVQTIFGLNNNGNARSASTWQKGVVYQRYTNQIAVRWSKHFPSRSLHELDQVAMECSQIPRGVASPSRQVPSWCHPVALDTALL